MSPLDLINVRYEMLLGHSANELNDRVNEKLCEGWSLYGNPFSMGDWLYQAVIKAKIPDDFDPNDF